VSRTFLWAHGLTSSRRAEDRTGLFDWSGVPATVIRYDARSHGEAATSPDPDDHRWDRLALDMLAVADEHGLDRFTAGGASMGCATTLHAAVRAPGRIEAMVLVIPPTAWETRAAQAALYDGFAALSAEEIRRGMALRPVAPIFADEPELARRPPDIPDEVLATVLTGAGRSDLPPKGELRRLDQPALILAWDTDPGHPVSTAEALHELLPNSELSVAATLAEVRRWPARVAAFFG
jgi:pimeloyl-ACP methyl ester carboxylesterase